MYKPSDNWKWCFSNEKNALFLFMDDGYYYPVTIPNKLMVDCAFRDNEFTVEDAASLQFFSEATAYLPVREDRQQELAFACLTIQKFHKPVQPKSWFFDYQEEGYAPQAGELVCLANQYNQGLFIVVEAGDNACVVASADLNGFILNDSKTLSFCQSVKVMHDRLAKAAVAENFVPVAMVG